MIDHLHTPRVGFLSSAVGLILRAANRPVGASACGCPVDYLLVENYLYSLELRIPTRLLGTVLFSHLLPNHSDRQTLFDSTWRPSMIS